MERKKGKARLGLKAKLTLAILIVGALPLAVGMVMAYVQGTRELRELSGSSFANIATETARKLDMIFKGEIDRTSRIASDPLVVEMMEKRHRRMKNLDNDRIMNLLKAAEGRWEGRDPVLIEDVTQGELSGRLKRYFAEQQGDSEQLSSKSKRAPTRALFLTDSEGGLVASISQDVAYANAGYPWWQGAYNGGRSRPYFQDLYFDERLRIHVFSLSVPVMDKIHYETVGVLHRVFDAEDYLDPAVSPIRFGKTGHVMLIDSEGTVMSCPILPTGTRLSDEDLISLVTQSQGGWVQASSDGHGNRKMSIIGLSPLSMMTRAMERSHSEPWYTFVWQSSDELFAPMHNLFKWISVLGLVGIGLLGTLGYVAAGRVVKPIRRLQEGAVLIGKGDLREPINVRTGDEIEQLAEEFNKMNAQLKHAFAGLKHQVEEQTQEVRYLEEYNEQVLQSVPTPIIILDQDKRVEYVNRAAVQALNLSNKDVEGSFLFDMVRCNKRSRERLREELRMSVGNGLMKSSMTESTPFLFEQAKDPLAHRSSSTRDYTRKELMIDRSTYHYDLFHIPARHGEKDRIGLVLRDTTHESRLQDQLIQTERLASLEILTSGIAHELNNPLYTIVSLGEAILEEKHTPEIKGHAKKIVEHAKRMAGIIQDFSGYPRTEQGDISTQMDINQCLDKALSIVGLSDDVEGLEVHKHYKPLPKNKVRPDEIVHVFVNMIKNAIQAMKGKGTIDLFTDISYGTITVKIRDSGPGIPKAFVPRIFDPFFTTKGPGQGTGLGLTIVRRIVSKYGGQIGVETEEGRGTTFILKFPV